MRRVVESYQRVSSDPISLRMGERIKLKEKIEKKEKTEEAEKTKKRRGWFLCEDSSGKEGWISQSFFMIFEDGVVVVQDYDATELSVQEGDYVEVEHEDHGWCWCRTKNGSQGWLPLYVLEHSKKSISLKTAPVLAY